MAFSFSKLFGDPNAKRIKAIQPIVSTINSLEADFQKLSDSGLKSKTAEFKKRITEGAEIDALLPEAFAAVREASRRTLGQRHFDVQLIGGVVMHQGGIAEMRTGEGKTLVATLPTYLNALSGKGVHVVTVNDYLSRRDAAWMGQIYNFLGLSVGCITSDGSYLYDPSHTEKDKERDDLGSFKVIHEFLRPSTRKESYAADITYGTNNEYGFDYLRDNVAYEPGELRQREYHFAIVDEIDSILIDESRTPLIISAPAQESEDLYKTFAAIARNLVPEEDYTVDEKLKAITLSESGIEKAEKALGVENIYTDKGIKYVHHLETAVRARALFHKDKEYVVRDNAIVIVDEFTGRLQPGRRWSEGLHQAIEAKEGVIVQRESRTFASVTFQNYFRMYKKLAGMTGTAQTSAEEFYKVYGLDTVAVPTNRPIQRTDLQDYIYQTEAGKFKAIAERVKEIHEKGQPVLIGTVSIERNELLSEYLKTVGVPHVVLNAKNHEREGEIIAQAGKKGAVTIATNMAGRGVDIKLGGNPATEEEYSEVKKIGGLFVLGTERHEARRIDNQLRGRAGRQGDPGTTQFFVSLEDTLMRVFASDMIKSMMGRFGIPEDQPIQNRMITRSLESAQTKIEGFNFDSRKRVLEFDDVLNKQRRSVYEKRRTVLVGNDEAVEGRLLELFGDDAEAIKIISNKKEELKDAFYPAVRRLLLQVNDMLWMEHLESMDYLRGSVNLRAYGQRDPLVEYRKDALSMFKEMEESLAAQILSLLPNIKLAASAPVQNQKLEAVHESAQLIGGENRGDAKPNEPVKHEPGRNDPCPCGSGKKYKKCHGA